MLLYEVCWLQNRRKENQTKINNIFNIKMGCVGFLAKGHIFVWQKILKKKKKNRLKYKGDIKEQRIVRIELISVIIIEIFRKKHTNFLYNSIHKFCQSAYTCMSLKVRRVSFCWFCHAVACNTEL